MKLLRQADREERDGDQHDAEERVDRAHVRACRARVDREAQHEVRAVEEEEDEEQHELVLAPRPPDAPGARAQIEPVISVSAPKMTPWWIAT